MRSAFSFATSAAELTENSVSSSVPGRQSGREPPAESKRSLYGAFRQAQCDIRRAQCGIRCTKKPFARKLSEQRAGHLTDWPD